MDVVEKEDAIRKIQSIYLFYVEVKISKFQLQYLHLHFNFKFATSTCGGGPQQTYFG